MRRDVIPWAVRAVADRVGRRGIFLGFLALLDIVIGYALVQDLPLGLSVAVLYEPFVRIMPIGVWSSVWIGGGLLCAVAVLWPRARPTAFAVGAAVKTGWALGYLIGWAEGLPVYTRGYQSAVIWGAFALVMLVVSGWRENGL